jgi:hypothetical protein
MSDLDALIYKLAFAGFLASLIERRAIVPTFLVCLSFAYNEIIYIEVSTWESLSKWFAMYALKDFMVALALFSRSKPIEFVLALAFIASSAFHQLAQIQVYNYILDAKHIRTEFMTYVTVFQLATMYLIIFNSKGGWNGGKRGKRDISNHDHSINRFFHSQTYKA